MAIVGRPNVGKSTLVNALVGQKVSIVSSRPQTTRNTIRGVVNVASPPAQLVLVDTPGLHRPRTALGDRLNRLVYGSLEDADATVFMLDATQPIGPGDRRIASQLADSGRPIVVAVNKMDLATHEQVVAHLAEAGEWNFAAYVPVSAATEEGLDALVEELVVRAPEGPAFFPPGMATDQPDALLTAEIVREQYLERLRDELPHSLAVVVDELETRPGGMLYVAATVYVERPSQKGIVIGKGGSTLKSVGVAARAQLEALFDSPVYLDLRVKVERDWQRREELLDRLGF